MNTKTDFHKYTIGYGFIAPFCLVVMSIYFIYKTPINATKLEIFSDTIRHSKYFDCVFLQNDDTKYILAKNSNKEFLLQKIKKSTTAKIWVKKDSKRKYIKQLELDDTLVLSYNYFQEIISLIILGILGLILIPFVVKARGKQIRKDRYDE